MRREMGRCSALTGNVDTTHEPSDVSGKSDHQYGQDLQWQVVTRRCRTRDTAPPRMDPRNQADKKSRSAAQSDVEKQYAFQFVPSQLPLPGRDAGGKRRQHENSSGENVEARRSGQGRARGVLPRPPGRTVESDSR